MPLPLVFGALAVLCECALAQEYPCPNPRQRSSLVAMSGSGQAYLFGGAADMGDKSQTGIGAASNDLWMYDDDFDPTTSDWSLKVPNSDKCSSLGSVEDPCPLNEELCCPVQRSGHVSGTFGFSTMGRLAIFGGEDAQGHLLNDAWTMESGGSKWKRATPRGGAGATVKPRKDAGATCKKQDSKIWIFGGIVEYNHNQPGNYFGDTNELITFDPTAEPGVTGQFVIAQAHEDACIDSRANCPKGRHSTQLSAVGSTLLVFGGASGTGFSSCLRDVWSFQTKPATGEQPKWSLLSTGDASICSNSQDGCPPARYGHAAAGFLDDGALGSSGLLFIFGGADGPRSDVSTTFFDDLWKFDVAQVTWQLVSSRTLSPSSRVGASMVFTNSERTRNMAPMMLFGGYSKHGLRNDIFVISTNVEQVHWIEEAQPGCTVNPPEPGPYNGSNMSSNGSKPSFDLNDEIGLVFTIIVIFGLAAVAGFMMFRQHNFFAVGNGSRDGSRQSMLAHNSEDMPMGAKDSYGTNSNLNPHPSTWN